MHTPTDTAGHGFPLELDGAAFRSLVAAALDRLAPFLDEIGAAPASWPDSPPPAVRPLPRAGAPLDAVLDDLLGRTAAGINTAAPGFMGYIPGGGLPWAAVADLLAGILNRYVGISPPAPHLAAIEREVIAWFADIVGYPDSAGGTFTSGGSGANLIAVAAAREDRFPSDTDADVRRGTIYVSDQAHHSVLKAARFAGIHAQRVRIVASDDAFRMRADELRTLIAADRAQGLEPFLLVASAGTTNTGAVDPLPELGAIAHAERLWYHIDAAYGGFFALTARGRTALAGMERADSVVLDPHKTLFLPYGTGALLVREPRRVARAFATAAEYLPPPDGEVVEAADLSFELTRPFRGLRVWLPLRLQGIAPFVTLLDEKLDLARDLHAALREIGGIEIIAPPQLSTLAFAARREADEPLEHVNRRTRALLERILADRRILVTGTLVHGRFVIRPSIVSFRTHAAQTAALIERIRSAVQ